MSRLRPLVRGGRDELLELVERLLSQVVAVHEEKDASGNRRVRLAAASRHLDQGTIAVVSEGRFEE